MTSSGDSDSKIGRFSEWLVTTVLRFRVPLSALLVVATMLAGWSATRVQIHMSTRDLYEYEGNKSLEVFDRLRAEFGEIFGSAIIVIEAEDCYAAPVLAYVSDLTRELERQPFVGNVRSVTNTSFISGDGDQVVVGPLLAKRENSPEEIAKIKARALHSDVLLRRLTSTDGKMVGISVEWVKGWRFTDFTESQHHVGELERILASMPKPTGVTTFVTGEAPYSREMDVGLRADQERLVPLTFLIIGLLLFLTFRSAHAVFVHLSALSLAFIWTFGAFPLISRYLDLISSTLSVVLLVYGVVDPIFILARFHRKLRELGDKQKAIIATYREMLSPCFLTSMTTALGFASYVMIVNRSIVTFGLAVAVGVTMAFLSTLIYIPIIMSWLPTPKIDNAGERVAHFLEGRAAALWRWLSVRTTPVIVTALALIALGAVISSRLQIAGTYVDDLPQGSTYDHVRRLEAKLSGAAMTTLLIEGPPDSMKRPEIVAAIEKVGNALRSHTDVTTVVSVADLLAEEHRAFVGADAKANPPSKALISQYLSLLDPNDRAKFVSSDDAATHLDVYSVDRNSVHWHDVAKTLSARADEAFAGLGVTTVVTGAMALYYPALERIVRELLWGFVIACAMIVAAIFAFFRSWRIAVLSIIPNLIPSLACFVVLAILNEPLNLGTSLMLSISIGGLFNTTIQLTAAAWQLNRKGTMDPEAIMEETMRSVAPAAFLTSAILALGFAVFAFSIFRPLQLLGILSSIVLGVGFVADMLVTPVLLRRFMKWNNT